MSRVAGEKEEVIRVYSPASPSLYVPGLRVQFRGGVADVPAVKAKALVSSYGVHGVTLDNPEAETGAVPVITDETTAIEGAPAGDSDAPEVEAVPVEAPRTKTAKKSAFGN